MFEEARFIFSELALSKRYANTKVLASSFMNKFLTLQKLKKDRDVRGQLLNQTETSMRNLLFLNFATSRYGTILVLP